MRRTLATLATILAGALSTPAQAPGTPEAHPFTVDDLVAMDRLSDPQPSRDGRRIAFVVSALDLDKNRRRTDLWLVDLEGTAPRRLTTHEGSDSKIYGGRQTLHAGGEYDSYVLLPAMPADVPAPAQR